MKKVMSLFLSFVMTIGGMISHAGNVPIGTPVIIGFESGNRVTATIVGKAIDPQSGVMTYVFQASESAIPNGAKIEMPATEVGFQTTFVDDKIISVELAGSDAQNSGGAGGGASENPNPGKGQSGNGSGAVGDFGGMVGDAARDGAIAGGIAVFVGILSAGNSADKVWKDMKKTAGIVNGLIKAYIEHYRNIQRNGAINTATTVEVQNNQGEAYENHKQNLVERKVDIKTKDVEISRRLDEQWNRYRDIRPKNSQESRLKSAGQDLLENSDKLSAQGERSAAELSLKYATDIADVLVGIDPITGAIRNTYELYTGINLITGESLTMFQRSMAGVGVLLDLATFGTGGTLLRGAKALGKVFASAEAAKAVQAATKTVELLEKVPSVATRSGLLYSDMKVVSSEVANGSNKIAAWSSQKGVIVEGTLKNNERYVRFYSDGSSKPLSEWVSHHGLEGKTVDDMVKGLALPTTPTRLAVVEVPAGSKVRFGYSAEAFGKPGGMIQHQILKSPVGGGAGLSTPYQAIKTDVPLNQILNADQTFKNLKGVL